MSIEDQAIHVLDDRCRYCGVVPNGFHNRYCNVVLSQRMDDLVSNLTYALNDVARKIDEVSRDVESVGTIVEQNAHYELFLRHTP